MQATLVASFGLAQGAAPLKGRRLGQRAAPGARFSRTGRAMCQDGRASAPARAAA